MYVVKHSVYVVELFFTSAHSLHRSLTRRILWEVLFVDRISLIQVYFPGIFDNVFFEEEIY